MSRTSSQLDICVFRRQDIKFHHPTPAVHLFVGAPTLHVVRQALLSE